MQIVTEPTPAIQTKTDLVIFRLNQLHYALTIQPIQQIIEMVTITPILKTEAWMEGIINYHGNSIPVINLRRHFNLPVVPYRWHTPIIIVNVTDHQVGLIVDDVLDVAAFSAEQIINPRVILPPDIPETPLLKGMIQTADYVTLLLDPEHLFDQTQVRALNAAASALGEQTTHQPAAPAKAAKKKRGETTQGASQASAPSPTVDSADPDIQTA